MSRAVAVAADFDAVPTASNQPKVTVAEAPGDAPVVGILVASSGPAPGGLPNREELAAAGFTGARGQTLLLPGTPLRVAVGLGDPATLSSAVLRDVSAAFALAAAGQSRLALRLDTRSVPAEWFGAAVEGIVLARYEFTALRPPVGTPLVELMLVAPPDLVHDAEAAALRGAVLARATCISRDLANCPPAHLSAARMGQVAHALGADAGLVVETFDRDQLLELRCGGILGVNGGSHDEPRMIKLTYSPDSPARSMVWVGKGIMYDSGGISLKPADGTHAAMKNDMSGAGALLAAMLTLRDLGCRTSVTGYLMCTDNMPSGSALKMGDVITARNGTTVEVANTDAEGRLVMMDALVLAAEQKPDAIVDIATLTGASMRALGTLVAVVLGNDQGVIDRVLTAARTTDERAWQLPQEPAYRPQLNSDVAHISNLGGPNAGAITAALFLAEFVDGTPWAHLDIAGTAVADPAGGWRPRGCTGFGARLLAELALSFAV
ncbi:leucyl aminopeptidase family protein [Pengzhenrongella frigida]|uniref:leucyl aminopeptidase family protein n=1 Tax=Pengzhenrongella frigida TaxID=1259133 RepID=UPI001F5D602E|nr:leucyl aminopeptidase [Cellulomonas sp. HLT2-17]